MDKHADHDDVEATAAAQDDTERGSLADLDDPGHLFDQTNGLAEGLNGDSDGTQAADDGSAADRDAPVDDVDAGVTAGTSETPFNPNDRI